MALTQTSSVDDVRVFDQELTRFLSFNPKVSASKPERESASGRHPSSKREKSSPGSQTLGDVDLLQRRPDQVRFEAFLSHWASVLVGNVAS